ncbi:MAG: PIN domain-containing protein [Methanotrichaceae archaeon]
MITILIISSVCAELSLEQHLLQLGYVCKPAEIASFIKGHPEVLGKIPLNRPKEIFDIFNLLPIGKLEVKETLEMVSKYALLTNDALNAATMKVNGITNIATNDNDFGRVDWLNIWKP